MDLGETGREPSVEMGHKTANVIISHKRLSNSHFLSFDQRMGGGLDGTDMAFDSLDELAQATRTFLNDGLYACKQVRMVHLVQQNKAFTRL